MHSTTTEDEVTRVFPTELVDGLKRITPDNHELHQALDNNDPAVLDLVFDLVIWDYPADELYERLIKPNGDAELKGEVFMNQLLMDRYVEVMHIVETWLPVASEEALTP